VELPRTTSSQLHVAWLSEKAATMGGRSIQDVVVNWDRFASREPIVRDIRVRWDDLSPAAADA